MTTIIFDKVIERGHEINPSLRCLTNTCYAKNFEELTPKAICDEYREVRQPNAEDSKHIVERIIVYFDKNKNISALVGTCDEFSPAFMLDAFDNQHGSAIIRTTGICKKNLNINENLILEKMSNAIEDIHKQKTALEKEPKERYWIRRLTEAFPLEYHKIPMRRTTQKCNRALENEAINIIKYLEHNPESPDILKKSIQLVSAVLDGYNKNAQIKASRLMIFDDGTVIDSLNNIIDNKSVTEKKQNVIEIGVDKIDMDYSTLIKVAKRFIKYLNKNGTITNSNGDCDKVTTLNGKLKLTRINNLN